MNQDKLITAKEIVSKYGLSYQAINRYTDAGLLPVNFKGGNIRFYNRKLVKRRLEKILHLSKEGYSLVLIRKKLVGI